MVRNVRDFSFWELMIPVVVVGVIQTIVIGILGYLSTPNSDFNEINNGFLIAHEKLVELRQSDAVVYNKSFITFLTITKEIR